MRTLGQRVREKRNALWVRQRDLAEEIGISTAYISKIEADKEIPTDDKIVALAEVLDLDPDELLLAAGRMPADVMARLRADPVLGLAFLRYIRGLPPGVLGVAHQR